MIRMSRLIGFSAGLFAFLVAHAIEVVRWAQWFGGTHQPWFLNNGAATQFTMGCTFVTSVAVALFSPSPRPVRGLTIALGAFAAMTYVLFRSQGGPGNIFPIVLVFGGFLLLLSSTLGAWAGRELRRALRGA
jgi:hypothetical protein